MVAKNHFLFASAALLIVIGLLITSEVTAARELGGTSKSKPCNYNMTRKSVFSSWLFTYLILKYVISRVDLVRS